MTWTVDTAAPVITATGTTLTLGNNPTQAQIAAALGTATAADTCSAVTPTATDGAVVSNGSNRSQTRTWTAVDACGNSAAPVSRTVTWTVSVVDPVAVACASGTGQVGASYSSALIASGGTPPYSYSIISGTLPGGLVLNPASGAIAGLPTAAGTFNYTAKALDSAGSTGTIGCSITINGGQNTCSASISGLVLRDCNADGSLLGEQGLEGFTVQVKDAAGAIVNATNTLADGSFTITNLNAGTYTVQIVALDEYSRTADPDGILDDQTTVTVADCEARAGLLFGYTGTAPAVYLVKTGPATARIGDTVTFQYAVTNTGNTCLYGGMRVRDGLFGGTIWHQTPVVPGEGYVLTRTYVIQPTDSPSFVSTAVAIGHPPEGQPMVTCTSTWTIAVSGVAPLQAPEAPTIRPGSGKAKIDWNRVAGATGYKVKRGVNPAGPFITVKTLTPTTWMDQSVVNGSVYYYVVSAVNAYTESPDSPPVSVIPTAGLPNPWRTKDIGGVASEGAATYDRSSRKVTVVGSGADIWNSSDEFRYAYQLASGNCSIVAKVLSIGNTDPWAKAGVMIRESLNADAKHASVFVTPGNGVAFQWRNTTGAASGNLHTAGLATPYWVKIVRSSSTFTAYRSADGVNWTNLGSQTISMGSAVYIGVAVTSHNDGALCPAVISNITATP